MKYVLFFLLLSTTTMPVFAARYSSGGEALFVGLIHGALLAFVIWAYQTYKNRKKNGK